MMSVKEVKSIYRPSRTTYRNSNTREVVSCSGQYSNLTELEDAEISPCKGTCTSGELEENGFRRGVEDDIASILNRKCAVINLAQLQLRRLLDETDRIFVDNPERNRGSPWTEYARVLTRILETYSAWYCILLAGLLAMFLSGLLLGASSCGTTQRRFNSPILACLNSLFVADTSGHTDIGHNSLYKSIA